VEIHAIPFAEQFMIYRPLRRLAFIGSQAMVDYVRARAEGQAEPLGGPVDAFLESIGFWEPDLSPPPAWKPSAEHIPSQAVLMMTGGCNLRCTYCYARGGEEGNLRLTLPVAKATIDAACDNARKGGKSEFGLTFHGAGEPTLNWKVMTGAIEHARGKDLPCHVSMSTNGLWSEDKRDYILSNFNSISLSFDGLPEVQDAQRPRPRGGGSFEEVMRTIADLDAAGMDYGIRMTIMTARFSLLPDCVRLICEQARCHTMQVEPCYTEERGTYADPSLEEAESFAHYFMEAYRIARRAGRSIFYSGARPGTLISDFCGAHEDALVVTPEGDLVNCFEAHDRRYPKLEEFKIGRAQAPGKLLQIEVDMDRVRGFAQKLEDLRESCQGCFCFRTCAGDCTSRRLQSPEASRRRCHANRVITREMIACQIEERGGVWQG